MCSSDLLRFGDRLHDPKSGFSVSGQVWDQESHTSVPPVAYARGLRMIMPSRESPEPALGGVD